MKTKINFLFIILLIPLLTSCLEYESNISFSGIITEGKTIKTMNTAEVSADGKSVFGLIRGDDIYNCDRIRKWDIETGKQLKEYLPDNYFRNDLWHFTAMSLSSDGKYLAGSGVYINMGRIDNLIVWDTETGKEVFSINPDFYYYRIKFSPDNKKLYMLRNGKTYDNTGIYITFDVIEFLDSKFIGYKMDSLNIPSDDVNSYKSMNFTKNGDYMFFDSPSFINLRDPSPKVNYFYGDCGTLNADGSRLFMTWDEAMKVYDTKSLNQISAFPDNFTYRISVMALSPGGKYFVTNYHNQTLGDHGTEIENGVQVWSAKDAKLISRFKTPYLAEEIKFVSENKFYTVSSGQTTFYDFYE